MCLSNPNPFKGGPSQGGPVQKSFYNKEVHQPLFSQTHKMYTEPEENKKEHNHEDIGDIYRDLLDELAVVNKANNKIREENQQIVLQNYKFKIEIQRLQ